MDAAEEVGGGFIVACGDGSELLEFGEEVFYQVAGFIKLFVVFPLFDAVEFGWNHDVDASLFQKIKNALLRIKSLIREQGLDFFKNPR